MAAVASLLIVLLLLDSPSTSAEATTRYVAAGGGGMAPCTNTEAPCPAIQTALKAAAPDDTIKVAEGLYVENLIVTRGVTLRGGYTTTDNFNTSFPTTRETVIHAAHAGSVITITNGSKATVEGFTVTGGNGDRGGGLLIQDAQPRIIDNFITQNSASLGGGIYIDSNSLPSAVIIGNRVESNTVTALGGGIFVWYGEGHILESNRICHNTAASYVGGLYLLFGSDHVVRANQICKNTSQSYVGGLMLERGQGHLIDSNQISNNTVVDPPLTGGGVSIWSTRNFTLTNNLIAFNGVETIGPPPVQLGGGGIHISSTSDFGPPTGVMLNNTIVSNTFGFADTAAFVGSGSITLTDNIIVGHGVGITATDQSTVTHTYNLFYENGIDYGGNVSGPTTGEIHAAPLFVSGPMGDFYLSQVSAGQGQTSPAVDAGSRTASAAGLALLTTRNDEQGDQNLVDLGYHYLAPPFTLSLVAHPSTIVANGVSTAALTATLYTEAGHTVPNGNAVVFSTTSGSLHNGIRSYITTTTNGRAMAVLHSVPASITIAAVVDAVAGSASDSATVIFQAATAGEDLLYLPVVFKDAI
jgi:hypothetical protein